MESVTRRPLITYILFAYNREHLVAESIQSAFAQTYTPLQIILSDNNSTDGTFEIMRKMAAEYTGPHEVILRQSTENNGYISHINKATPLAKSDIVIMASDDDIALPDRAEQIARTFAADPDLKAVYSGFLDIGERAPKNALAERFWKTKSAEHVYNGGGVGLGATYAYKTDCFRFQGNLNTNLLSDDRILPFRACLLGAIGRLDEPLIHFRRHPQNHSKGVVSSGKRAACFPLHLNVVQSELNRAYLDGKIGLAKKIWLMSWLQLRHLVNLLERQRDYPGSRMFRGAAYVLNRAARAYLRRSASPRAIDKTAGASLEAWVQPVLVPRQGF